MDRKPISEIQSRLIIDFELFEETFFRSVSWNRDVTSEKLSFTMRREFDKHKEEEELIKQLKSVSEINLTLIF